jgi:hypothetical protein
LETQLERGGLVMNLPRHSIYNRRPIGYGNYTLDAIGNENYTLAEPPTNERMVTQMKIQMKIQLRK